MSSQTPVHSLFAKDQSTRDQEAEMTVDKHSLTSWMWAYFPDRFPHFVRTALSSHSNFVGSRVYACLAVTCNMHFWQNDQGLSHASAVKCYSFYDYHHKTNSSPFKGLSLQSPPHSVFECLFTLISSSSFFSLLTSVWTRSAATMPSAPVKKRTKKKYC